AATKVLPRQLVRLRQQIANLQDWPMILISAFCLVLLRIKDSKDFLGLVEKFYYLSGRYDIELTVGDAVM
ncbi:hypothetical protein S83_035667, partial [Arachis hypogaea]